MPKLHSPTHTISLTEIDDYEPQRATGTYSDGQVLHYACHPDGGPVYHVLDPAAPHLCRPVYADLPDTHPPAILKCKDGDLGFTLVNGTHFLVADVYRWHALRRHSPMRSYAVCIERANDPALRAPVIAVSAASHHHAVAIARCHYPAIVGRTVAVWRHPGADPRTASVLTA